MAPVHNTHRPYHWPERGKQIADTATHAGVAERCPEPAVQQRSTVDGALLDSYDRRVSALELSLVQTARPHEAPLYRLPTIPGVGKIFSRGRHDDIHAIPRVPRGQDLVSSCRLGQCAKASAGQHSGTSGPPSGHADRQGGFAEAAGLLLRNNAPGQKGLARLEKNPGQGKAVTVVAHKWARAVYSRDTVLAMDTWRHDDGSRADVPAASLDTDGLSRNDWP